MATSEALIKYYDCLKDSFNKIQDKDNKTALINAALRPKIREEFDKSQEVLSSYLNYIQEVKLNSDTGEQDPSPTKSYDSLKIHETIQAIINSRPQLASDFVHSVVKVFPKISQTEEDRQEVFLTYLENSLKICTYLKNDNLIILISKILEELNPPKNKTASSEELEQIKINLVRSYELTYDFISTLEAIQLDSIIPSITSVFVRDFISAHINDQFKYLLLYLYSFDAKFAKDLLEQLWKTFKSSKRPLRERLDSIKFASSFISRATYINLEQLFQYIETASKWCNEFIDEHLDGRNASVRLSSELEMLFYTLSQSIFYIITQRYREMYEEETITRLTKLNLNKMIDCTLKPLQACDKETEQRFMEVKSLYRIVEVSRSSDREQSRKRRRSERETNRISWKPTFQEECSSLPARVEPLYRRYYHHKFFTITRQD